MGATRLDGGRRGGGESAWVVSISTASLSVNAALCAVTAGVRGRGVPPLRGMPVEECKSDEGLSLADRGICLWVFPSQLPDDDGELENEPMQGGDEGGGGPSAEVSISEGEQGTNGM